MQGGGAPFAGKLWVVHSASSLLHRSARAAIQCDGCSVRPCCVRFRVRVCSEEPSTSQEAAPRGLGMAQRLKGGRLAAGTPWPFTSGGVGLHAASVVLRASMDQCSSCRMQRWIFSRRNRCLRSRNRRRTACCSRSMDESASCRTPFCRTTCRRNRCLRSVSNHGTTCSLRDRGALQALSLP